MTIPRPLLPRTRRTHSGERFASVIWLASDTTSMTAHRRQGHCALSAEPELPSNLRSQNLGSSVPEAGLPPSRAIKHAVIHPGANPQHLRDSLRFSDVAPDLQDR